MHARIVPAALAAMILGSALAGAVLCALPLAARAAAPQPHLYITTEHSPPSSMRRGGDIVGSATDKIRAIMERSAIAYTIDLLPWKRAYTLALQRTDACVYSTTRTPEREHLFKWVGPTEEGEWVLFARADHAFTLRTLDDARTLRIGTYNGDARDEYLRRRGFLVDSAQDDAANPRKLLMGRIDLWAVGVRAGKAPLLQKGWSDRIVPVLSFHRIGVYLACNRAVPDALVARMNEALAAMKRDGSARRIERRYDGESALMAPLPPPRE
jgi:polar amino acid transport system substrate-binding protein